MTRRGRKRQTGKREPNGRLSRAKACVVERVEMTEHEAKSVALAARRRHVPLPAEYLDLSDGGRPNAGTPHGILRLQGALTAEQWAAAEWWIGTRLRYLRAIQAPNQVGETATGEWSGDEAAYAANCRAARQLWAEVCEAIQRASTAARSPILAAFDVILLREHWELDHMVGDLRLGLNALHREFLGGRQKAA